VAFVVPAPGATLTGEDVRDHLRGRVASWWIPERVELLGEIPKTATGKWSKQALRQQFADREEAPCPSNPG
jgi:fatty-acyl-CoA synthase